MSLTNTNKRPLSPHLTVYRTEVNMITSILHRITGIALMLGISLIVIWFLGASFNSNIFNLVSVGINSIFGKFIMLGSLFALWYHFFAGIRHLIWDLGIGFDLQTVEKSSYLVVLFTMILFFLTLYFLIKF
jgi:succinate dehydrogenase / fumarate reductase cytochrome b subunit